MTLDAATLDLEAPDVDAASTSPSVPQGQEAAHAGLAAARVRRDLPDIESALPVDDWPDRLHRLWIHWQACTREDRDALRGTLDGRYARLLACLDGPAPWTDRDRQADLLTWCLAPQPLPLQPAWAPAAAAWALLRAADNGPEAQDAATDTSSRWLLTRLRVEALALLDGHAHGLDPADWAPQAHATAALLAETDAAERAQALARCFEAAVLADDAEAAAQALAVVLADGRPPALDARWLGRWLEGSADTPLQLAGPAPYGWLPMTTLHLAGTRLQLGTLLHHAAGRTRWAQVRALLGDEDPAPTASPPLPTDSQCVGLLSRCWALAEAGAHFDPVLTAARRLARPAASTLAALQCAAGLQRLGTGDLWMGWALLTAARMNDPTPSASRWLGTVLTQVVQERLPAALPLAAALTEALTRAGSTEEDTAEVAAWQALAQCGDNVVQALAHWSLAKTWTEGTLRPQEGPHRFDAARAIDHWHQVARVDAWMPAAVQALAQPPLSRPAVWRIDAAGAGSPLFVRRHATERARLVIVMACVHHHRQHAQLERHVQDLPDHDLLFIDNPALDWYSDERFEAVCRLIEREVLPHYLREQVLCHWGSMGGHGALKIALRYGFAAAVFNPQIDLDLWARWRPGQRALLTASRRHRSPLERPVQEFERLPLYLAVGSYTPDRLAFDALLPRLAACRHGNFLIEKVPDARHGGLHLRLSAGDPGAWLRHIDAHLAALQQAPDSAPTPGTALPPDQVAPFWVRLAATDRWRGLVQVRDGITHVQPLAPDAPPGLSAWAARPSPAS